MSSNENPWKILSSHVEYDNPWIAVTEYQVLNPSGGKGIYGKVHFKNIAVGVLVIDDSLNTWLVGQFRFVLNQYSWEIPEGGGAMDTPPLESAKRELLEETGLVANNWQPLLTMHLSNSVSDEIAILFLARDLRQEMASPEETEQLTVRKMPFEEVYKMVCKGEITDSMTVAAVLKFKLMLSDGQIS